MFAHLGPRSRRTGRRDFDAADFNPRKLLAGAEIRQLALEGQREQRAAICTARRCSSGEDDDG